MGRWDFRNIGISVSAGNLMYAKQLLECLGVDFEYVHGSEVGEICGAYNPEILGDATKVELENIEIYYILNTLFGESYLFYEKENGTTVSDYYYREEETYDPKTGYKYTGIKEYCYGCDTALGEVMEAGCDLEKAGTKTGRRKIRKHKVKKKNIDKLIKTATAKGYNELADMLCDKFKSNRSKE